jgi:hypothetical protein
LGRHALLLLLAAAFAWTAPASAKPARKGPPLVVKKIRPRDRDALVPLTSVVTVTFSRPVDQASVTHQTVELRRLSGEVVPTSRTFAKGGRVLVLAPSVPLDAATEYQAIVTTGVLAAKGGRALKKEKRVGFFTDVRAPFEPKLSQDQFAPVASTMSEGRAFLTATTLPDGRVLFAGGMTDYEDFAAGGDVFDPSDDAFHPAGGALVVPRWSHAAVAFGAGALLVGGSSSVDGDALSSTEFYDPAESQFVAGPPLLEARDRACAVRLADGRIFVCGGLSYADGKAYYSRMAEILDPATPGFRYAQGQPVTPRAGNTATLLTDGRVLIVGGDSQAFTPSIEIFDPATERFTTVQSAALLRRAGHTATLLPESGLVVVVGGGAHVPQIFDPGNSSVRGLNGWVLPSRLGASATVLPGGEVLVAGGLEVLPDESFALSSMDLVETQGAGAATPAGVRFAEPRYGHAAATLRDGRTLFAGGVGIATEASLADAVLFTP